MSLIRPRLTDHFGLGVAQHQVDFAIPYLNEDIPLCVDPFLLWKSPAQQENALHTQLISEFNRLGILAKQGKEQDAVGLIRSMSECDEVGLGFSANRKGSKLGAAAAAQLLRLFVTVPELQSAGFVHVEEAGLLISQIGKDRISDFTCNYLKSFLIDYTVDQCNRLNIPLSRLDSFEVYSSTRHRLETISNISLPINPETGQACIFVPKRWLRANQWINSSSYALEYYATEIAAVSGSPEQSAVLSYNRDNFGAVRAYVLERERRREDCKNDLLFAPLPAFSANRKFMLISKLPTGRENGADKKFEDAASPLLATLLYPHLDFAAEQVRTDSGAHIRDVFFYNSRTTPFLQDVHDLYESKQIVFELKNTKAVESSHINQLSRYLANHLGRFGVLVTRNRPSRAMIRNTIDLWSAHRKCILILTDEHLKLMVAAYTSKQREPIDVLHACHIEFQRLCPS
jgi:hypothetical protein